MRSDADPASRLRHALDDWYRDRAGERVAHWREDADARSDADVAARHAWLGSQSAVDTWMEAQNLSLLTSEGAQALRAHLHRAVREQELASARDTLRALRDRRLGLDDAGRTLLEATRVLPVMDGEVRAPLARALERCASDVRSELQDARVRADDRARAHLGEDEASHPDAAPPGDVLIDRARRVLEATDDLANGLVGHALEAIGHGTGTRPWHDVARALRDPALDALFPARSRWRRVAHDVAALDVERELSRRVRVEARHDGVSPRMRLAVQRAPYDVRIAPGPVEHGLGSELAAAEGVGRALGHALVAPALPIELRRPPAASVARALGMLFAQLPAETQVLTRIRGLGRADAEHARQRAAAVLILDLRMAAAATLASSAPGASESLQARAEAAQAGLSRAACAEFPESLAALFAVIPSGASDRLRARLAAPALWAALRERYDEDWYRNPRTAEAIRAACERGGWMSAERWLHELGGEEDGVAAAVARVHDWA